MHSHPSPAADSSLTPKSYGLSEDAAALLVRSGNVDSLSALMTELARARDLSSIKAIGNALMLKRASAHLHESMIDHARHVLSAWCVNGNEEEKAFAAEWQVSWGVTPESALVRLNQMMADNGEKGGTDFDVDAAIGLIELAAPLTRLRQGVADVFSEAFYLLKQRCLRQQAAGDAISEKEGAKVFRAILAIDSTTVFCPQTSEPTYDLSKRSVNAHPDSAEGLTFKITRHSLLKTLLTSPCDRAAFPAMRNALPSWLDAVEEVYGNGKLLQNEAAQAMLLLNDEVVKPLYMLCEPLLRGWLDASAAKNLFTSCVQFRALGETIFPVALAQSSMTDKVDAAKVLRAIDKAGVNLETPVEYASLSYRFNGTLLHQAAMHGSAEFLGTLLSLGADRHALIHKTPLNSNEPDLSIDALSLTSLRLAKLVKPGSPTHQDEKERMESLIDVFRSFDARAAAQQVLHKMKAEMFP